MRSYTAAGPAALVLLILAGACPPVALAQATTPAATTAVMQVTGGLSDFQVLPRDDQDKARACITGLCQPQAGAIEARLCDRGVAVADLDWARAGEASDGQWSAEVANLPVGGPYDLEVRLLDAEGTPLASTAVREILVGDLWILAGQSNMQGVGKVAELPPPVAAVHMFSMQDRWRLGREPLHALFESRDEAHWQGLVPEGKTREEFLPNWSRAVRRPEARGVGPGLPFAWELYRLTGVPVGVIPCARGGTSLEEWNPNRKEEGGRSLYGAMLRRAAAAGGRVRGVVWYQGESDTGKPEVSGSYLSRFRDFVAAVRSDLGSPDLCFLYVQLGRFIFGGSGDGWDTVREAQRLAEPQLGRAAVAPALDAPLVDAIHLDTAGQMRLGRRLARHAAREVFGREVRRGPRLAEVRIGDEKRTRLLIRFSDVNGRLRAEGRPAGFSLDTEQEPAKALPLVLRVDLPQDRPDTVELLLARPLPEGARLWYGRGLDPYANLTDDEDMGMLAFGPVAIPFPAE